MSVSLRFLLVMLVLTEAHRAQTAETTQRIERMLPNDTVAFVSFRNVPQLTKRWNRLNFRSPLANPALQAVIKRVEEHFPRKLLDAKPDWAELLSYASGDACIAMVPSKSGKPTVVLVMDVRGQAKKALGFFYKLQGLPEIDDKALALLSDKDRRAFEDNQTLVARRSGLYLRDDVLFAATEREVIKQLNALRDGKGGLLDSTLYRDVMDQCQASAEKGDPDMRFFVRPIEYITLRMGMETAAEHLFQARATGFDAVRGIGGVCWFDHGSHSLLYRVGIFAPDQTTTAMRMLLFANGQQQETPPWIPKDVGGVASFFWDMPQAFESFAKLFGPVMSRRFGSSDDVFEDVLQGIHEDPNGPMVDIRGDCIQKLGQRVLVVSSLDQSPGAIWDRTVCAFELKDEVTVARSIKKYIQASKSDGEVTEDEINGHILYAIRSQVKREADTEPEVPKITFGDVPLPPETTKKPTNNANAESLGGPFNLQHPNRTIFLSVAHSHLLWGNNGDLLKRLLVRGDALADDNQYRLVQRELDRLADGPTSFRSFSRYGDEYRLLARCMDAENIFTPFFLEAGTLGVQALAKERQLAKERRSAKKQQSSPKVLQPTRSPGPAGWFAKSLPNGWRIVGFVLPAEMPTNRD